MRETKLAYLPFYVRDWRSDPLVLELPWGHQTVYMHMILLSWERGPLPDDPDKILRGIGYDGSVTFNDTDSVTDIVTDVLGTFWQKGANGWENPRLEAIRADSLTVVERNKAKTKAATKAAAEKRRASPSVTDSVTARGTGTGDTSPSSGRREDPPRVSAPPGGGAPARQPFEPWKDIDPITKEPVHRWSDDRKIHAAYMAERHALAEKLAKEAENGRQ